MLFFGKKNKKEEQLKILSEREIQSRLYGRYRPPHLDPIKASPQPPKPDNSAPIQAPAEESSKSPDLFSSNTQTSEVPSPPEPASRKPEPKIPDPARSRPLQKIEEWMEREDRLLRTQRFSKSLPGAPKPSAKKAPVNLGGMISKASFLTQAVSEIGRSAIPAAARWVLSATSVLDLRNPKLRRVFYWLSAGSFLWILLLAIHLLNLQREKAMKSPVPKKPAAVDGAEVKQPQDQKSKPGENKPNPKAAAQPVVPDAARQTSSVSTPAVTTPPVQEIRAMPPSSEAAKPYVIQVATFVNIHDAKRLLTQIQETGFLAFVQDLRRQNGRVYYCVFLGRFKDAGEAEKMLAEFKKKEISQPFQDAFVRPLG